MMLCMCLCTLLCQAQECDLWVAGHWVSLKAEEMQTEIKPGWSIAGKKLKDTRVLYLWGRTALQMTDDRRPVLRVRPAGQETLVDYALVRLRQRRDYRRLPKDQLRDNDYVRLEPEHFDIKVEGDDAFVCTPLANLPAGEYILVCLTQTLQEQQAGYRVFPMRVP